MQHLLQREGAACHVGETEQEQKSGFCSERRVIDPMLVCEAVALLYSMRWRARSLRRKGKELFP